MHYKVRFSLNFGRGNSWAKLKVTISGNLTGLFDETQPFKIMAVNGALVLGSAFSVESDHRGGGKYRTGGTSHDVGLFIEKAQISLDRRGRKDADRYGLSGAMNGFPTDLDGKWPIHVAVRIEDYQENLAVPQTAWNNRRGVNFRARNGRESTSLSIKPDGRFKLSQRGVTFGAVANPVTILISVTSDSGEALFRGNTRIRMSERRGSYRY